MRAKPILLCLVAVGLLTLMNGLIKGISPLYDPLQLAFVRYVSGGLGIAAIIAAVRPGWPARETLVLNLVRGGLGAISGTSFFYALSVLALADAFTVGFLAPLFVAPLAMVFLKERPRGIDLAALALGFIGMLIIVRGGGDTGAGPSLFGIGMGVISAVTYAISLIMLRFLALQSDRVEWLVMFMHGVSAVLLAPLGLAVWRAMPAAHLVLMAGAALIGVSAHLMMARAFSEGEASRLVPIEYTALIYAAAMDFAWFGRPVATSTLLGAAAIITGALLASKR